MKKIFFILILISAVIFAQGGAESIRDAMCELVSTSQSLFAMGMMIFILLAVPLILIGIYLVVKKKEMKNIGIILIIAGVAMPVLLAIIYLMIPYLISALIGSEVDAMECVGV